MTPNWLLWGTVSVPYSSEFARMGGRAGRPDYSPRALTRALRSSSRLASRAAMAWRLS